MDDWTPAPKTSLAAFLEMVRTEDYLILDTETTGLNTGEICQIAIVNRAGDVLLNRLVKTISLIPTAASNIHGITDDMVAKQPGWAVICAQVRELTKGKNVVVYNAVYDRKMMHQSDEACGLPRFDWRNWCNWYCAMEAYAEFYGEWNDWHGNYRWQSLTNACYQQGLNTDNAHDALGDCLMTHRLIEAMKRREYQGQ